MYRCRLDKPKPCKRYIFREAEIKSIAKGTDIWNIIWIDLCNTHTQQKTGIQNTERTPGNQ